MLKIRKALYLAGLALALSQPLPGFAQDSTQQAAAAQDAATEAPIKPTPFNLMRSFIFVSVKSDADLPDAYRWLYKEHVADSISQFAPYVTRYATYRALPVPKNGDDFGTYNWIMTEHYWLINPFNTSKTAAPNGIAFGEAYDKHYLEITNQPTDQGLRPDQWVGSKDGYHPTVFAFAPVFWEDDFKGSDRTVDDGANYRWLIIFKYPKGVSQAEGDKWFKTEFAPAVAALPEVNREISSRVLPTPHTSPFQRVAEIWFNSRREWETAMAKLEKTVKKPSWATYAMYGNLS